MSDAQDAPRVVSASRDIAASPALIFELIADPAQQPRWDGNDNLAEAQAGQRVRRAGDVFTMTLTSGSVRENQVVEFEEGRRIAWRPSPVGSQQPGHLWRWELEPLGESGTRVTHTYDWTSLTDESRFKRARATTSDWLRRSLERLAVLAELRADGGSLRPAWQSPTPVEVMSSWQDRAPGSPGRPEGEHGVTDAARRNGDDEPDAARLRWTSVPRWPVPELPAAACYLACCFGDAGERRARTLLETAGPGVPVRTETFADQWDAAVQATLGRLIDESFAGVRVILAGPESVVMRAAALAKRLGATSEELVLIAVDSPPGPSACVTGTAARRVFCAACRAAFDAVAALGEDVTCPGCAATLTVDRRFSRPHAAYFGWPAGLDPHR
jgi:uncharacterized protein YndB with AHSA1/START domain